MSRQQTSLVLHMLHVGTQHQTPRLQPKEEMTRQQTSLVLHMLHVSTQHQTPRKKGDRKKEQFDSNGGVELWPPLRSATEQVKLMSFRWEGVDFKLGIRYVPVPLNWKLREYLLRFTTGWIAILHTNHKESELIIGLQSFLYISYGLVLGSILFSIFVNDLGENIHGMQMMLYYSHVIQRSYS